MRPLTPRDLPIIAGGARDIAKMFGVSKDLIYAACRSGELPSSKVGTRRIILVEDMKAFLDARRDRS
jgi:excisionase family DNA binding protein